MAATRRDRIPPDIDDEISGQALAGYLLREVRLLMASAVCILDKRVVEQMHRRR